MKKFQPNIKFYKKNFESYSSSDEFDLKKRVQITNEVPPYDMFDALHSVIKNDLWKWFLGSSLVTNDVTYNENTDGVEQIDKDGTIKEFTIAKYVNGVRAKDYGPIPKMVWNPNFKKDFQEYSDYVKGEDIEDPLTEDDFKYTVDYSEKARRIEIDGALLPEVDLMLHEAYRYLSVLYPDHPDFMKLLTQNEFEDEISQAAYIIDYRPDHIFFNWLSEKLDYSGLTEEFIDEAMEQEAAKLKIRNLLNHSYRRKFFGSKVGYRMFGSDVFQHVSLFPAAQYVPYKEDLIDTENPEVLNFKWYRAFEDRPEGFKTADREVDRNHVLYKKRFRLFDWTNETYDFPNRYVEPAKVYGTAWPTPYSQFVLYEYPLQKVIDEKDFEELKDGLSTTRTIKNNFKPGQKINIGGQDNNWTDYQTGHIAAIREEPTYKVELTVNHNEDGTINSNTTIHENINTLTVLDVDVPVNPIYTPFKVWPSNRELIDTIAEYETQNYYCDDDGKPKLYSKRIETSLLNRFEKYLACNTLKDATDELHNVIYDDAVQKLFTKAKIECRQPFDGKFTPDPHQDGCLYMAPEQYMTLFEDELNITLDTSAWNDYDEDTFFDNNGNAVPQPVSNIEYGVTNMSKDGVLKEGDIITYKDDEKEFSSSVLGISNAFIQFKIDKGSSSLAELKKAIKKANEAETSRYGLVMKLSDNNEESGGKKVVVYGNPIFGEPIESDGNNHYMADSVYFNIKAIPRIKSHAALRTIYGDNFKTTCKNKFEALDYLVGYGNTYISAYYEVKRELDEFNRFNNAFVTAYTSLISAAENKNLLLGDSHWHNFNNASKQLVSLFKNKRPLMEKQLKFIFVSWHNKYDVTFSKVVDIKTLTKALNELISTFKKYYDEYTSWEIEKAAIELTTKHYKDLLKKDYSKDFKAKTYLATLNRCDKSLFEDMIPNRAFLLNPLPEDIFLEENLTKSYSYSLLTGQDEFVSMIEFEKNEFNDMIVQKECFTFGKSGILKNCMNYSCDAWNFGSINTATIVETHFNPDTYEYETLDVVDNKNKIDFLDDYYHSENAWIQKYNGKLFPNNTILKLNEDDGGISREEYLALDEHDQTNHYYLNEANGLYYAEETIMTRLPYMTINEEVQEAFNNDDSAHKFAYGDPNMMEMFIEDN